MPIPSSPEGLSSMWVPEAYGGQPPSPIPSQQGREPSGLFLKVARHASGWNRDALTVSQLSLPALSDHRECGSRYPHLA